ncbi:centrosomal protein CCDC61 isoform X4 [Anomaloglossus baeobatrachus]|uniref:centrosomal protein CCDC61 isoform X4 n=1 Tax=Anomaloglossus baeobatrachus TaxID=238106 RepID=UPI003F501CED
MLNSSESVTLDLLTYADLELLRHRKAGGAQRSAPPARSAALNSKRYLILIYSVEFDRIHYPLPLPYIGKPDPVHLRQVIRGLKDELAALKLAPSAESRETEVRRLREELQRVTQEKQEADLALQRLQDLEIPNGKEQSHIRILKRAVQTLESELQKERSRSQRLASKRKEECRQLTEQLEELRAMERTLRLKVKSLSTELAMYKRGRVTPTGPSPQSRSSSAGRGPTHRSSSRGETAAKRERSSSRDRNGFGSREGRSLTRQPRLSPSPVAVRPPRFDPTAYVRDKERKQKETDLKKCRRLSSSPSSVRGQRRSSSVESIHSHRSYQSSGDEMDYAEPLRCRFPCYSLSALTITVVKDNQQPGGGNPSLIQPGIAEMAVRRKDSPQRRDFPALQLTTVKPRKRTTLTPFLTSRILMLDYKHCKIT